MNNIQISTNNAFGYQGKVYCYLEKDGKIIEKHILKNNGTDKLFKGICYALSGELHKDLLPNKVAIFTTEGTNIKRVSPYVTQDAKSYIKQATKTTSSGTVPNGFETIFHFRLPCGSTAVTPKMQIDMVRLYSNSITTDDDHLAEVNLTDKITIPEEFEKEKYSIVIEWHLIINNGGTTNE